MMVGIEDIFIEGIKYSFDPDKEYMKDGHAYCKACHERKDGEIRSFWIKISSLKIIANATENGLKGRRSEKENKKLNSLKETVLYQ